MQTETIIIFLSALVASFCSLLWLLLWKVKKLAEALEERFIIMQKENKEMAKQIDRISELILSKKEEIKL